MHPLATRLNAARNRVGDRVCFPTTVVARNLKNALKSRLEPMSRIDGIDLARAVAVFGMFAAHLGYHEGGWWWLADGRSSALFALLAGCGLGFMTRAGYPNVEQVRAQYRRILLRAWYLALLGVALLFLNTPVVVILSSYAVMFALAVPFLTLNPRRLVVWAVGVAIAAPPVVQALRMAINGAPRPGIWIPGVFELVSGYYPALTWLAYCLVGVALTRIDLDTLPVQAGLVGIGGGVALGAYGTGWILTQRLTPLNEEITYLQSLVMVEPHTDSGFEILGNIGVCLVIIGLSLFITRWRYLTRVLYPIRAAGSMSLTIYVGHLLFIWVVGEQAVRNPVSLTPLIGLIIGSLLFASVWARFLGRGPLERALGVLSSSPVTNTANARHD